MSLPHQIKMLKSYSPVPANVIWCGNKAFADDQIKVRLLEWAQFQYDYVQRRSLDTQRERENIGRMPCGGWIMLPQAKECQGLPANQQKPGKGHGTDSPSPSPTTRSQPSRLPQLWSNIFMLLQDTKCMVLCYISSRKLTHLGTEI